MNCSTRRRLRLEGALVDRWYVLEERSPGPGLVVRGSRIFGKAETWPEDKDARGDFASQLFDWGVHLIRTKGG